MEFNLDLEQDYQWKATVYSAPKGVKPLSISHYGKYRIVAAYRVLKLRRRVERLFGYR